MGVRETSLTAYRSLDLQQSEAEFMRLVHLHYPNARFTRKEFSRRTGWEINRVAGRANGCITKGYLKEYDQTRDGGHLLSVAPSYTQEKGHGSAPLSASHNSGGGAVTPAAGPDDQSPGAAFDQGPSRRMGQQLMGESSPSSITVSAKSGAPLVATAGKGRAGVGLHEGINTREAEQVAHPNAAAPVPTPVGQSVTPPAASPSASTPSVAAAPYEQLIHDSLGRPFYTAVGWGPGWPPDQDHLHRRGR